MLAFTFTSKGHRAIDKLVAFTPMTKDGIRCYNWAFGDIYPTDNGYLLNDIYPTNNGDTKKVLYTVVSTLPLFFEKFPSETVLIKGSDERRTRLYALLIARHWEEINHMYEVKMSNNGMTFQFNRDKVCDYILISLTPIITFDQT